MRNSGKNSGHYSHARKAADIYKRALRMLERAVLKDQTDQDLYDKTMFELLSRQVLAYLKVIESFVIYSKRQIFKLIYVTYMHYVTILHKP